MNRCAAALAAVLPILAADAAAQAPSFDCAKAATKVERTICAVGDLAALDREMARLVVARAQGAEPARVDAIRQEQRAWLRSRNECERHPAGSSEIELCLRVSMTARTVALRPPAPTAPAAPVTPAPPREVGPPVAGAPWSVTIDGERCTLSRSAANGRRFALVRARAAAPDQGGAAEFAPGERDVGLIEPGDRVVLIVDQVRLAASVAGDPPRIAAAAGPPAPIRTLAAGRELVVVRQIDTLLRVPLDGFAAAYRDYAARCGFDPAPFL